MKYILVDRKSTRLNSSHVSISYAVFCVKQKMADISCLQASHAELRELSLCAAYPMCCLSSHSCDLLPHAFISFVSLHRPVAACHFPSFPTRRSSDLSRISHANS